VTDTTFINQVGYNMVAITIELGRPRWLNVPSSSATRPNCVEVLEPLSVWKRIPNPSVSGQFSLLGLASGKYLVLDSSEELHLVSSTSGYYQYWLEDSIPLQNKGEVVEDKGEQKSQKEEEKEDPICTVTTNPFRIKNAQFSSSFLYQTLDGKNVVMRSYATGDPQFNFRYLSAGDGMDIVDIKPYSSSSFWKCANNSYDLTLQSNPPTNSDPAPYVFILYRSIDTIMDSFVPVPDPSFINHCGIRGVISQGGGWCQSTLVSGNYYLKVSTNTSAPSLLTTPQLSHLKL